jgi:hypothetical protein
LHHWQGSMRAFVRKMEDSQAIAHLATAFPRRLSADIARTQSSAPGYAVPVLLAGQKDDLICEVRKPEMDWLKWALSRETGPREFFWFDTILGEFWHSQVSVCTPRRLNCSHHPECRYAAGSAILPRHSPSSAVAARNCLADSAAYPRSRPCGAG